jgi:hypothetical protein
MTKPKALHKKFKHPNGFIGLPRHVFESLAYRSLSLKARCLLDEFQNLYRPNRNGRIVLPIEIAAERLGVAENTVRRAFDELQNKGFIIRTMDGDWSKGRAREWRLTYEPCNNGREPTDEWRLWEVEHLNADT